LTEREKFIKFNWVLNTGTNWFLSDLNWKGLPSGMGVAWFG
jgi:hypothetical protein